MWCMNEQVAHRLWRSFMGHAEVVARWPAISMASSIGSTSDSNMGCCLAALRAVDGAMMCGWRRARGLERQSGTIDIR